jgi:hypothetical protein
MYYGCCSLHDGIGRYVPAGCRGTYRKGVAVRTGRVLRYVPEGCRGTYHSVTDSIIRAEEENGCIYVGEKRMKGIVINSTLCEKRVVEILTEAWNGTRK